jgi:hypothetical protein
VLDFRLDPAQGGRIQKEMGTIFCTSPQGAQKNMNPTGMTLVRP